MAGLLLLLLSAVSLKSVSAVTCITCQSWDGYECLDPFPTGRPFLRSKIKQVILKPFHGELEPKIKKNTINYLNLKHIKSRI